ncbi:HNH endonuclease [Streptomyces scabiei]|uniref:HNH endonuclease n=1 Tax=Streptomyces scabiei TaxID=1930 RepID=UPI0038F5E2C1
MKTMDFPSEAALLTLMETAFTRPTIELSQIPDAWLLPTKRLNLGSDRRRKWRKQIAHRDGAYCFYCAIPFDDVQTATMDHIIPRRLFPAWTKHNLVLSCRDCNEAKQDDVPSVLMGMLTYLISAQIRLMQAPVERSLVPVGGAA